MRQFLIKQGYTQSAAPASSFTPTNPTSQDSGALGVQSTPAPVASGAPHKPGLFDRIANAAQHVQDFAVGAAKGAVNTVKGAADLGAKIFSPVGADTHATDIIPKDAYTPKNTAEKLGMGAEQTLEFVAPNALIKDAEIAVNAASKANKLGKFSQAAIRVAGKAAVEGAAGGTVRAAQTGGDVSETAKATLLFGLIKGVTGAAGEISKAAGIPERLYNTVFKSTYDDALNELKTTAYKDLQSKDPAFFKQALESGLIKPGKAGEVIVNERLAREALDRGLKGTLQGMATSVVKGQLKSEMMARSIASGYKGTVKVTEPQFYNVLKGVEKHYEDVGFGEMAGEAKQFAALLKKSKGQLTGEEALGLRRFLDKMRFASSYQKDPAQLSLSQANFKYLSDALRKRVNQIPGMGEVMKEYSFNIDALEALATEAKRRGNNQVLSLIDSIFFASGPAGVSLGTARKIMNMPASVTNLGAAIEKGGTATRAGAAAKGAALEITGRPEPQR